MKTKGLVTCYICKKRVNVKDTVLIGCRYVCKKYRGVDREIAQGQCEGDER